MVTWIGKPVKRFEDDRLLRGQGAYVDDLKLPGMLFASVLRSVISHARIVSIDTAEALSMPGVVAVLTARDIDGVGTDIPARLREGMEERTIPAPPVLATRGGCHVGQAGEVAAGGLARPLEPPVKLGARDRARLGDEIEEQAAPLFGEHGRPSNRCDFAQRPHGRQGRPRLRPATGPGP